MAGSFGEDDRHAGRRILKVPCFDTEGAENNLWGRLIEGPMTVVDLHAGEVIDVFDTGIVPVPEEAPVHGEGHDQRPVDIDAPQGTNFTMEGGEVVWQKINYVRCESFVNSVESRRQGLADGVGCR